MLRFNANPHPIPNHPHQHFNTSYVAVQPSHRFRAIYCVVISIHLMLRFNFQAIFYFIYKLLFQYILCCGSTSTSHNMSNQKVCISIHLMLRFNSRTSYQVNSLIIISIHLMLRFNFCQLTCQ